MNIMRIALLMALIWTNATWAMAEKPVFTFTAIPSKDEDELKVQFEQLAHYLETKLNVPMRYMPVNSYEAAIKLFVDGKVSFGWFGGYSLITARRAMPSSSVIAQGYEDASFKSYFIAHTSTGLSRSDTFPKGIAGRTFLFGSPVSTSGRLVPEYWIRKKLGLAPAKAFSRVSFSGDHSSTLQLIQAGVSEIGVLNYKVYEDAKRDGKVDESKVRVIWETPPFPDNGFLIRGGTDETFGEGFTQKLQKVILDIDDKSILKAFARSRFTAAKTEQYEFLEELAGQIESENKKSPKP